MLVPVIEELMYLTLRREIGFDSEPMLVVQANLAMTAGTFSLTHFSLQTDARTCVDGIGGRCAHVEQLALEALESVALGRIIRCDLSQYLCNPPTE